MASRTFFEQALANFAFDTACGGAIRHLADSGYTIRQIQKKLDYPASYEQVQNTLLDHFLHNGVLLKNEPDFASIEKGPDFIIRYDSYGKPGFCRTASAPPTKDLVWRESRYLPEVSVPFSSLLEQKISENGVTLSYVSCDFGLRREEWDDVRRSLDERHRDYIDGIPWEQRRMYHRLTPRIQEILVSLGPRNAFLNTCFFLKTAEKLLL